MTGQEIQPTGKSNPLATVGMILGIISVLMILTSCCVLPLFNSIVGLIFGIAALILGLMAKKQIKEQGVPQSQAKMANAAFILGIVGIIIGLIGLAVAIITKLMLAGPAIDQIFQDIVDQLQ